jgi:flavin reductase (DIM6/NTAB) family NADH-FMN oxidoreductase RutF/DNA-binding MarR family transcriptional regulator
VTIVTTLVEGAAVGVTANSFTSISIEPPLILWAISRNSRSFQSFEKAEHFTVNVLSARQTEASAQFANTKIEDKFAGIHWRPGVGGVPVLSGCAATLQCRVASRLDGGDHVVMLGEVLTFASENRLPLVFAQGQYGVTCDLPDRPAPIMLRSSSENTRALNSLLAGLMYRAYAALSSALDTARATLGLTHVEARLLAAIETYPSMTIEELAPQALLDARRSRYILDDLVGRELIEFGRDDRINLTAAGAKLVAVLVGECRRVEAEQLAGAAEEDVAAAKRLFGSLIDRGRCS